MKKKMPNVKTSSGLGKKRPAVKTCVPIEHKREECTSTQVRTRAKTSSAIPIHHCATQEFCQDHTHILFGMAPRLLKDRGPFIFFCEIDMRVPSVGGQRRGVGSFSRTSSGQSCRRRLLNFVSPVDNWWFFSRNPQLSPQPGPSRAKVI